jgi:hypothetical protein
MVKALFISRLMQERDKFEILLNRVYFTRQMTMVAFWQLPVKDMLDILTRSNS